MAPTVGAGELVDPMPLTSVMPKGATVADGEQTPVTEGVPVVLPVTSSDQATLTAELVCTMEASNFPMTGDGTALTVTTTGIETVSGVDAPLLMTSVYTSCVVPDVVFGIGTPDSVPPEVMAPLLVPLPSFTTAPVAELPKVGAVKVKVPV